MFPPAECDAEEIPFTQTVLSLTEKINHLAKQMSRFQSWSSRGYEMTANEAREQVKKTDPVTEKRIKTAIAHNPTRTKIWQAQQPRAHKILATPLPGFQSLL